MEEQFARIVEQTKDRPGFSYLESKREVYYRLMGFLIFTVKIRQGAIRMRDHKNRWSPTIRSTRAINDMITRHLNHPHYASAWVVGYSDCYSYHMAPDVCCIHAQTEILVVLAGEQCRIRADVEIKYSFDEARAIVEKFNRDKGFAEYFNKINKITTIIRDHPDFSLCVDTVYFRTRGCNSDNGIRVMFVGSGASIQDLFTGRERDASFEDSIDYLYKLMCLSPKSLIQSDKVIHKRKHGSFFAYPQFVICPDRIIPTGEVYQYKGREYRYSFEQFRRLIGALIPFFPQMKSARLI